MRRLLAVLESAPSVEDCDRAVNKVLTESGYRNVWWELTKDVPAGVTVDVLDQCEMYKRDLPDCCFLVIWMTND